MQTHPFKICLYLKTCNIIFLLQVKIHICTCASVLLTHSCLLLHSAQFERELRIAKQHLGC